MAEFTRVSIYLSEDERRILDATARRLGCSRSEVMRHLTLYHGICGGDFPLTSKILAMPPKDRERVIADIRRRAEEQDPAKPQAFREWVKEAAGQDGCEEVNRAADRVVRKLLGGVGSSS